MKIVRIGKLLSRTALVAGTALFATCAPSSITEPPPMRPVPEGPALAGQRIGLVDLSHATPAAPADVAARELARATIAL